MFLLIPFILFPSWFCLPVCFGLSCIDVFAEETVWASCEVTGRVALVSLWSPHLSATEGASAQRETGTCFCVSLGGEKHTGGGRESGSDAWKQYMRRSTW